MTGVALALETSTRVPSISVRRGALERELELSREHAHASDLLPALGRLLAELGAGPADITTVVVGTGPGSYTGLRVGVATALGLVRASRAALIGVPSTEATVFAATELDAEAAVVIDARSAQLYFARYRRGHDRLETLDPPCVVSAHELDRRLPRGGLVLADDDAVRAASLERRSDLRIERGARPRSAATMALGLAALARRGPDDPARVEPLYLRAFAAKSRRR